MSDYCPTLNSPLLDDRKGVGLVLTPKILWFCNMLDDKCIGDGVYMKRYDSTKDKMMMIISQGYGPCLMAHSIKVP